MAKKDQTPATTVVSPDWPRDVHGFTSGFRREVARTVGRIKGNDEKFDVFMKHLREAANWARQRHEIAKRVRDAQLTEIAAREAERAAHADKGRVPAKQETDDERKARQANAGIQGAVVNGA